MNGGVIAFIVVYCLLIVAYFFTAPKKEWFKYRVINKCLLAFGFTIFAIVMFATKPEFSSQSVDVLLLVGIILSMIGDVGLLFSFKMGGCYFLSGNICIFTYEICNLINHGVGINKWWWVIVATFVVAAIWFVLFNKFKNIFQLGNMKALMNVYLVTVTAHGMAGLATCIYLGSQGISFILLGLGCILFMLSDWDITFDRFVIKKPWTLRLNAALYFVGLLLIVLSMYYVGL